MDPQRIAAIGLLGEVAGQDHPGAEEDRTAVEGAQELRFQLHELHEVRLLGRRLGGDLARQLQRHRAAPGGVDLDLHRRAVEVAGRVGHEQVAVRPQHGLRVVGPGGQAAEPLDREREAGLVEGDDRSGLEPRHVASDRRRGVEARRAPAGTAARAGLAAEDHDQAAVARGRLATQADLEPQRRGGPTGLVGLGQDRGGGEHQGPECGQSVRHRHPRDSGSGIDADHGTPTALRRNRLASDRPIAISSASWTNIHTT